MPYYETVFIARQDLTETQVKDLTDQISKIITASGGKIHKTEQWGLRTLAYRINKNRKGHYTLIESDCPSDAIIEVERQLRLHEDVLRSMTIREKALSEGPSVMMDKGGSRDDNEAGNDQAESKKEEAA